MAGNSNVYYSIRKHSSLVIGYQVLFLAVYTFIVLNCLNLSTLSEQDKTVIYVFFFYFFQYFIYLPFILVQAFHSLQKLDQNDNKNRILLLSQNFKPGRIRDVNLQRYAVNSKCQEYWQCIHKNSYSFYTKFVNFFPYNVLYKKVQIFELENHENCHFMKKIKILKF